MALEKEPDKVKDKLKLYSRYLLEDGSNSMDPWQSMDQIFIFNPVKVECLRLPGLGKLAN